MGKFNVKIVAYPGTDLVQMITYRGVVYAMGHSVKNNERDDTVSDDVRASRDEKNLYKSQRRAKQAIFDVGYSNEWNYFITLTLNPDKVDRFDYDVVSRKVSDFFKNYRRKAPDMVYMVVPERHKDGAYHFHALLSGVPSEHFIPAVNPNTGRAIHKGGKRVYNWVKYRWGYSTATLISDSAKAVSYVTKYISKDLLRNTPGRRHYWLSRNIQRPNTGRVFMKAKYWDVYREPPVDIYGHLRDAGGELLREKQVVWRDENDSLCEAQYCIFGGIGVAKKER